MRSDPMPIHDWTRVDAGVFHDFHVTWIGQLRNALNSGLLPSDYYALAEQMAGGVGPDVLTLESSQSDQSGRDRLEGAVALADAPPKVRLTMRGEIDEYALKRR